MATPVKTDAEGYELEVIGSTTTNPTPNSQHPQTVDAKYLWSFAQEEALVALSEQGADKRWRLITDPERRARRIAARYADLYFSSSSKSGGKLQLYWPALAAFVVKDIVEAYRYSREQVLEGGWANAARTSAIPTAIADMMGASPYEHSLRVYAALAKGNLWLFQDIYPWLWYVLEYGLNDDGTFNGARMQAHVDQRNASTLQQQSAAALKNLPFGAAWMGQLKSRIAGDPVYAKARTCFDETPVWGAEDGGYGQHLAEAMQAHRYVRQHVKEYDAGYRFPPSTYWPRFDEAFYVMEEERKELGRVAGDGNAIAALERVAQFKVTPQIQRTYQILAQEYAATSEDGRFSLQQKELVQIAQQEQLNILQPLIYDDAKLGDTMKTNHRFSRITGGLISPHYAVVYSASPTTGDASLTTVFDQPKGFWDWMTGMNATLPNADDRMAFVANIARDFNRLMGKKRNYMEGELQKIRGWLNA